MAAVAFVLLLPFLLITLHDLVRRPTFRRLALRNIGRRRGEAMLVVLGSLLGTAIITSSFIVGDTLEASIRDGARTQYGPVDVVLETRDVDDLPAIEEAVASRPVPGADEGVVTVVRTRATVATPEGPDRLAEPSAGLFELDVEEARRLGDDPSATGFDVDVATPEEGEALINERLAEVLEIEVGDVVDVFAYGQSPSFEVAGIVPAVGMGGMGSPATLGGGAGPSPNVFLPPGTLTSLAAEAGDDVAASPPSGQVLVSNEGGVFDAAAGSDDVVEVLEDRVADIEGVDVTPAKAELLEQAETGGETFTTLFSTIGFFSVIAGILLLVNIFVMLAEERKSELGMLRAVGLKRNHLVRSFGMEGGIYALVAAMTGALVGIGVGRAIVLATAGIFEATDEGLALRFSFTGQSLASGFAFGLLIGLITVWGTSLRIGRLNVIRAIRDLPEPTSTHRRIRTVVGAGLAVVVGGLLFATGLSQREPFSALAGPALALFALVPLLNRIVPRRVAVSGPCAAVLVWGVAALVVLPDVFDGSDIALFVLQGVLLVSAAVALVATNADVTGTVADRFSGSSRGLATRLGLAYPLAKRFRTSLLLGMYAIVVFTLTFLATFSHIFGQQAPTLTEETRAGYDVMVDSNPANPVTVEQLERRDGVEAATALTRSFPAFTAEEVPEERGWPMSGFGPGFIERDVPTLNKRAGRFDSDEEVWEAVLASDDLAIISDFFLSEGGGPAPALVEVGDTFTAINEATGDERELTVAGVVTSDFVWNGVFVAEDTVVDLMGPLAAPVRHYVAVSDGADADRVAQRLTADLLASGADATSFESAISEALAQQTGFFRLFEGFLGLGLIIGIAGLGVVMVRAVRERRRQIGMLRAMGFTSGVVRAAFLVEAGFIAAQGIVIGVGLGMIVSYLLLTYSSTFGDTQLAFSVPWLSLAILLLVPFIASLVAVAVPASRAAAISPAAALRIAD